MGTVFLLAPLEHTMSGNRRTSMLPLPGAELERLKQSLARTYGSSLWEGAGERILVVRVPRPEPDIVNDIELAVEHLAPTDTQGITAALLVGDSKPLAVPIHPFMELMAQRVRFDHDQCTQLRPRLAPTTHQVYRAPGDARKTLRLALRLGSPSVQDLGNDDLDHWSATLGPDLEAGRLTGVRAVYLIADQDEVRLDADLFFQDLRKHAAEAKARHDLATQLAARQTSKPKAERVAYAPLRSIEDTTPPADADEDATTPGTATRHAATNPATTLTAPALPQALQTLEARLRALGFDVMVRPTGLDIDLAAERPDGDPQRLIAWTPERLTPDLATQALRATRTLEVDLALIVCDDAEPEGRKRLVATKVRWLQPKDVALLGL